LGASPSVAEVSEAELSPQQRQPRTAFAGFNDPLLNQVGRLRPPGGQQPADDLLRGDTTSLSETGSRRSPRQPLASISGANTLPHSDLSFSSIQQIASSSNLACVGAKSGSYYEKPLASSHFSALLEPTYPPLPGLSVTANTPHWTNSAAWIQENGLQYPAVSSGAEYRVAQGGSDLASSSTAQPSYPSPSSSYPSPPPSNPATQPSYPSPLPSYPSPLPSYPTTQPNYPSPKLGYPSPKLLHPAPYPQTAFSTSQPNYAASQTGYPTPQPSYPTPQPSFTTAQPSYPTHQPSYPTHAPSFPIPEPSYPPAPRPSYAIPQPNYPAPQSHYYSPTQSSYQGGQPSDSGAQLKTPESPFLNSEEEDELQRLSLGKIS
jgi:hypothetical protein